MPQGLSVQDLIAVSINLTPPGAQAPSLSSFLIIGDSAVINTKQRYLLFSNAASIGQLFGTAAPEYLAAVVFFAQTPTPTQVAVGRWVKTASAGILLGGPLTAQQQAITNWNTITNGSFRITVNGGAPTNITAINLTSATNLNGVASLITAALTTATVPATCVWNGTQFVFSSTTSGPASTVAPLVTATTSVGTDISNGNYLLCTAATMTYEVDGLAPESAIACVTLFDTQIGFSFFGFEFAAGANNVDIADSDHLAIAAYVEGLGGKHLYGLTTAEAAAITSTDATSIGYQLKQLAYNWTFAFYSSANPYAAGAYFGMGVSVNYAGNNTTINFMWQQAAGITPENLSETASSALQANNYNFFANYNNGVAITQNGTTASGNFVDTVWNCAWLKGQVQTNMFNIKIQNNKIPQTDSGMQQLAGGASQACEQGVTNAMLAPGTWTAGGVGQIITGQFLAKGYYIYVPPIAGQAQSARAARQAVPIQILAKLAGAVNTSSAIISVNP